MPKQSITQSTVTVTNIQSLPDVVVGDATNLKATFDKTGLDEKTYINTVLIPELNGNDGSKKIGHNSANLGSDNVADALEEVRLIAVQAQAGDILPNSITNTELGVDVKVGSLASLTTTEKSSVVGAINEIDGDVTTLSGSISSLTTSLGIVKTDLNIARTAKTTTGSAVALAVDTDGTFDLTRNGNVLTVIPNVTNTGSVTINVDGQGAKTIKKANDSGTLVNLEAGDIKINVPTQLVRDTVSDFFVYAPKGGNPLKTFKNQTISNNPLLSASAVTNRLTVNGNGWVVAMISRSADSIRLTVDGVVVIGSSTQSVLIADNSTRFVMFRFNSSFVFASANNFVDVVYLLGNDFEKSQAIIYAVNSGTASTSLINVTGKGWIYGINIPSSSQNVTLIVDGVNVVSDKILENGFPLMVRFNVGFNLSSNNSFVNLNYVLD